LDQVGLIAYIGVGSRWTFSGSSPGVVYLEEDRRRALPGKDMGLHSVGLHPIGRWEDIQKG